MALRSLLARTRRAEGLVGLGLHTDGVSLAHVIRRQDARPELALCQFQAAADGEPLGQALAAVAAPFKGSRTPVSNCLGLGATSLSLVEAPEVSPSELRAAVRWRIKDTLDFHIDDAVIDVFDIPGQRERGRTHMMYVVAARFTAIQERVDLLEGAGLRLTAIDIPELAQRNVAGLMAEDAQGVALLHFTADRGLLTLTQGGVLYLSRTLDLGWEQLSAALRTPSSELDEPGEIALEARRQLDSVVLEVQRSLDYCESHFSLPPIGNLVIGPTPEAIPEAVGYLRSNLGVKVQALDLNDVLDSADPIDAALQWRCFLAIGAALRVEQVAL